MNPNYAVLVTISVCGTKVHRFHVALRKQIRLPFAPLPGQSIGFCSHSEFNHDEEPITRVMWHQHNQEFHVQLETVRCDGPLNVVRSYIGRGFSVHLLCRWPNKKEAMDNRDEDTVVFLDGNYYTVTDDELTGLKIEQREFVQCS